VATKPHLACGFSSQGRGVTIKPANQATSQQTNFFHYETKIALQPGRSARKQTKQDARLLYSINKEKLLPEKQSAAIVKEAPAPLSSF
jgi:hypothetical protein